jgi:hypothetical protein
MTTDSAAPVLVRPRRLRFDSFDQVLQEAADLNAREYQTLGNWSLGQALNHLGRAMHGSIDGPGFPASLKARILGRLFYRHYVLHVRFPAGVRLPRQAARLLVPGATSYEDGLAMLRSGLERLEKETRRVPHPILGPFSVRQWNRFHLRHAELHLGFFVPK